MQENHHHDFLRNRRQAKPAWLKVQPPKGKTYEDLRKMLSTLNLVTVCQEAHCPNIEECWGGGTATFMLMGDLCTRACKFCAVKTGNPQGALDLEEPQKVGHAIAQMKLDYVVLTSVDRDDLPDQGAGHFARTIEVIRNNNDKMIVEVLTPDFSGSPQLIHQVCQARPHVFAHNLETVERLTPSVRDRRSSYETSLRVLALVKDYDPGIVTKTSLMLGLGERDEEVYQSLVDLRKKACDVVTFGQYLSPSFRHLPVQEYVEPEKFDFWAQEAKKLGFLYTASGPLVRSSYKAGEYFLKSHLEKANGNC